MNWRLYGGLILTVFLALMPTQRAKSGELSISGTGMALAAMQALGDAYAPLAPDVKIKVLPSMGSAGGLRALQDGVLSLSLSARGLKPKEREGGLQEVFCFRTALVLATQRQFAGTINLLDLPALYSDVAPKWPDGTPLKVILRASSGSEMPYLAKRVPGLAEAFSVARSRSETPVGMTDQLNADIAEKLSGSLSITSLLQIASEKRSLAPERIDGILPSPATLKDGSYPFDLRVCVIAKQDQMSDEAVNFNLFLKSAEGSVFFETIGALPETKSF